MEETTGIGANGSVPHHRRVSLASQLEQMTSGDACQWNIEHQSVEKIKCHNILSKPTGKRTLEDIHMLKSLFASTKLLNFFSNLDASQLYRLYQSLKIIAYPVKGAYVFHEGDDGDNFYFIYSGQVEVVKADSVQSDEKTAPTYLSPGDIFGERALLSSTDVRSASIIVLSAPTELVFINRVVFDELLKESHDFSNTSTLEISKRFRSNKDIVRNIFMRSSTQRSEKDLKFTVEYLKGVKFFSRFLLEVRKQLCKVLRLISAVTNTVLFAEGQVGRHFYIIFTGSVDVSIRAKNRFEETKENVVSRLSEGEYFGELALSQADGLRRATVVCTEFCELLVLGRDEYEPLIKKYQNEYHAQYVQMLRKNPCFIGPEWDDNTIEGICSVMTEKHVPYGGEICKQGSRASELFIVTRGECQIIHEGKNPITNERQVYELGKYGPFSVLGCAEASAGNFNDIFVRDYSILAESPMKILVLSRFDIFHLLSPSARKSLQRFSDEYSRESVQSRVLKSVAWEKYKKSFITHVMAENHHHVLSDRSTSLDKAKSGQLSPPVQTLVDPGSLTLERQIGITKTLKSRDAYQTTGIPYDIQQSYLNDGNGYSKAEGAEKVAHFSSARVKLQTRKKLPPVTLDESIAPALMESHVSHAAPKSKNLCVKKNGKVLLLPISPIKSSTTVSASNDFRLHRTRSRDENVINVRKNAPGGAASTNITATVATIWDPVHGVSQHFTLLGFMKEQTALQMSRGKSGKLSEAEHREADQTNRISLDVTDASRQMGFTRFRVFGKFRDIDDALNLYRQIRIVEKTSGLSDRHDCSHFAIYEKNKLLMALKNDPSDEARSVRASFPADFPQATSQRFACVSALIQSPIATSVEDLVVHVYQCFSTFQSAVRFARHATTTFETPSVLSVVPLFEWIALAQLKRFDARSNDLELVMRQSTRSRPYNSPPK